MIINIQFDLSDELVCHLQQLGRSVDKSAGPRHSVKLGLLRVIENLEKEIEYTKDCNFY